MLANANIHKSRPDDASPSRFIALSRPHSVDCEKTSSELESHSNLCTTFRKVSPSTQSIDSSVESSDPSSSDDCDSISTEIDLSSLLPLPTSSPGYVTHAHQQAMSNRITSDKLEPGGAFDPEVYTPVFLHDTLMLPGSLASLLGKVHFLLFQSRTSKQWTTDHGWAITGLSPRNSRPS